MSQQDERAPRVFISSTFQDLTDQRAVARDAILSAGAMPVLFEFFGAQPETPQETIRQNMVTADAVVFLIGHRAGQVNPTTGRTYLEEEYEIALRSGKPLLAFAVADDAPWPPKFVDSDRTRIEAFRRRLLSEQVIRFFSGTDDLRLGILEAVSHLLTMARHSPQTDVNRRERVREVSVLRLLLSSPGDVADERERVSRAVFRFNQQAVEDSGMFIKLVRWEDMAPQIGPPAQSVINKQIGEYDIFCGIMWNRFGTPTEIAASGTKEEFDGAVATWEADGSPWIVFYFCDRAAIFTTPEQLDQKRWVLEFRATLRDKGVVRAFLGPSEFEDMVYEDLKRITSSPEFLHLLR